jgi:hypothetical protein
MNFLVWLVTCKPSSRTISVDSARKYIGQVLSWMRAVRHARIHGVSAIRPAPHTSGA